jgi:hypothetical protein
MSNRRYNKSETYQVYNYDTKRSVMLVLERDAITDKILSARKVWFEGDEIVERIADVPVAMIEYALPFFKGQVDYPTWVDGEDA